MIEFKREQTQFLGGETLDGRELIEQPVRIWKRAATPSHVPEDEDTEDYWKIVTYADGREHIVHGSDLHPHPEAEPTNVEFITHLMEYADSGPMMQMFIIDALTKWSGHVVNMTDEQRAKFENGFISPDAWIATAKEVETELAKKYGSAQRSPKAA